MIEHFLQYVLSSAIGLSGIGLCIEQTDQKTFGKFIFLGSLKNCRPNDFVSFDLTKRLCIPLSALHTNTVMFVQSNTYDQEGRGCTRTVWQCRFSAFYFILYL